MRKCWLLLLLFSLSAGAEELTFTLHTDPSGAEVRLRAAGGTTKLGLSGEVFRLDTSKLKAGGTSFLIRKNGYEIIERPFLLEEILLGRFPSGSVIRLQPLDRTVPLVFYTEPVGARVYLEVNTPGKGKYLGLSGQTIEFDMDLLRGSGAVNFIFELEGYEDSQARLTTGEIQAGRCPPHEGAIKLQAGGWWVSVMTFVGAHSVLLTLTGLLLSGLALWGSHRRKVVATLVERNRTLEELQATADGADHYSMTVLGNYRVLERIGKGATATVYRAVPNETLDEKEAVAIKILEIDDDAKPEFLGRFRREASVCQKLYHPNIVKMIDYGEHTGFCYLVLEMLDGETLGSRSSRGVTDKEVLAYLRQLMDALQFAHGKGLIHRDIKPANVMVQPDGRIRIMDFGLARLMGSSSLTKTGTMLGTPFYMSPEQITEGAVDGRADQYALGVMAYELFAGRKPFESNDAMAVIYKHLTEDPPPLTDFRPDLAPEIEAVIMKMIAKKAEDRFDSLDQAADQLEAAARSL